MYQFTPFFLSAVLLLSETTGVAAEKTSAPAVLQTSVLDRVWAGHPVGFDLLTHGTRQFAAYYNAERQMTIAARDLPDGPWTRVHLPEKVKWDSHNYITMAVDDNEHLHVSGNMHNDRIIYFQTTQPLEIRSLQRIPELVGSNEKRCTYPRFMRGPQNEFIFTYRDGSSGDGQQIYNVYDSMNGSWSRLLDQPLTDGEGRVSAYLHGPRKGPDGFYHLVYVWRETSDCATNRDLSYVRSRDLRTWETSTGTRVMLPLTQSTSEVIDPVPPGGGLINGNAVIGFDSRRRPVISYHKYGPDGNSQIYSARLEEGEWNIVQSTNWDWRWNFSGGGSIIFDIDVGPVRVGGKNKLVQTIRHPKHGGTWEIDEATLKFTRKKEASARKRWPSGFMKPGSSFPGMQVEVARDRGKPPMQGVRYVMRWETLPPNRDLPRDPPFPEPSTLQVIGLGDGSR